MKKLLIAFLLITSLAFGQGGITYQNSQAPATSVQLNPTATQTIQGPASSVALNLTGSTTGAHTLDIHNVFANGINLFVHSNTSFRAPAYNCNRSDGTQASPT